jgi:CRISPR-associated protein Cmr6
MARPLTNTRRTTNPFAAGTNLGLVWNKFFNKWEDNFSTAPGGPEKTEWINKFAGKTAGDAGRLKAETGRLEALAKSLGGTCEPFTATAPFVTGTGLEHPVENGFAWHHTLGVPCLPGSSVKGLIRAWAGHWEQGDETEITRIFGSPADDGGVGSVIVFDALPMRPVDLIAEVLTPHDGGWRQGNADAPSDWHSPVPIPWLAIAPGAEFLFAIAPRPGAEEGGTDDAETAMGWLNEALEWIGAGARTAVGFGRFLDKGGLEVWKCEEKAEKQREQERREREDRNAPPVVGKKMEHEEWGVVSILELCGEMAWVNSIDNGEDVKLPISELKRP